MLSDWQGLQAKAVGCFGARDALRGLQKNRPYRQAGSSPYVPSKLAGQLDYRGRK